MSLKARHWDTMCFISFLLSFCLLKKGRPLDVSESSPGWDEFMRHSPPSPTAPLFLLWVWPAELTGGREWTHLSTSHLSQVSSAAGAWSWEWHPTDSQTSRLHLSMESRATWLALANRRKWSSETGSKGWGMWYFPSKESISYSRGS